jgi:NadR type nicotinamide-nucleotide adenylyltransferase
MIRRHPLNNLQWLYPSVRAHYVLRITVVGSESTGKTNLCEYLAERFATSYVPEYGREYSLGKVKAGTLGRWSSDEFIHIAREQQRREDEAARSANRVLFCDTDALATRIWHERYVGKEADSWPLPENKTALYLIPFPDVPFVAEEVRDSEHLRYWMYERFVDEFKERGYSYQVLNGDFNERRERAVSVVEEEIARCS